MSSNSEKVVKDANLRSEISASNVSKKCKLQLLKALQEADGNPVKMFNAFPNNAGFRGNK